MILSEFAGAAQSLNGSIVVNPWDSQQVANAIHEAVTMEPETRKENHKKLFKVFTLFLRNGTSVDRISSVVCDEVLFVLLGNLVRQRDGKDQCRCLREFHEGRSFDRGDDGTEIRVEGFQGIRDRKRDCHCHWKHQQPATGSNSSCGVSPAVRLLD